MWVKAADLSSPVQAFGFCFPSHTLLTLISVTLLQLYPVVRAVVCMRTHKHTNVSESRSEWHRLEQKSKDSGGH